MTIFPFLEGKPLVWDSTCSDSLSKTNMLENAFNAGTAADKAEDIKKKKYNVTNLQNSGVIERTNICYKREDSISSRDHSFDTILNDRKFFSCQMGVKTHPFPQSHQNLVVSLFVRYVSRGFLRQELLALLPLKGQTRGEDLVGAVVEYFETNYIPLNKIVSISTDGAESMLGSRKGFITLIKIRIDHEVITLHCIIHQEALSAQTFKDFRKEKATLSFVINPLRAKVSNLNLLPFEINAAEFEMQLLDLTCKELWASKFIRLSELLETLEQKHCLVSSLLKNLVYESRRDEVMIVLRSCPQCLARRLRKLDRV
ncbi:uncharacterized protein LOC115232163 [Octopus sinensis]|uniref:Uncharacterized protein LOC115232163 n=1 Tax=Octopus sinensis TaxID=2607531 RepID=A0A6P7UA93_9MOLL|nr:uncharacterized protein LOC115232163 [Octopus sinensis]